MSGAAHMPSNRLRRRRQLVRWLTGEWAVDRTDAQTRRMLHYWLTVLWVTVGTAVWIVLRHDLWFVGFMSLYAIWVTHLAGWAAETPVEHEDENSMGSSVNPAQERAADRAA